MSQILDGRGVSAGFDSDAVHITRSGRRVDIPLAAVREVRAAGARVVEIVLTDGTAHRVEGANPTATAAFAAALTAVLPEERDPAGGARFTDTRTPPDRFLHGIMALLAVLALAYVGYAVWVALTHGTRVLGVIVGILPLGAGAVLLVSGVAEALRRIVLGRRGITVLAEAVGKEGKKTVYRYTDADGEVHRYACRRTLQRIQLAYDPAAAAAGAARAAARGERLRAGGAQAGEQDGATVHAPGEDGRPGPARPAGEAEGRRTAAAHGSAGGESPRCRRSRVVPMDDIIPLGV
ncbi:hypothetical protein ACFY30_10520 [Streptomyces sp. NPDC000345]|uniref:hypothetical protein n=1 Tax=Streptomyces sp. NPDC000345 TaxID=3364537 RepID=UPI00369BEDA0